DSRFSSVPESPMSRDSPASSQACLAPWATEAKNGFAESSTTRPRLLLWPDLSCLAAALRTKPSSSIASLTLCAVASATFDEPLTTWETVPTETPARSATSRILTLAMSLLRHQCPGHRPPGAGTCLIVPEMPGSVASLAARASCQRHLLM